MSEKRKLYFKPIISWILSLRPSEPQKKRILSKKTHGICGSGKNCGEAMQMMEVQKVLFQGMGMVDKVTQGESKHEKKRELTFGWRGMEKKSHGD